MASESIKDLRRQIELLEKQLLDAQKSTSLGELVSTTTHEFNNVLMTIINYAKMGMRYSDQPTRDKAFSKILAASERAARITHSVLGMARNRNESFDRVDLEAIIRESMILLEREMQKYRIAVEMELNSVPRVRAIGNQIQQVLLNLLINARQAMPQGGRLIIRLTCAPGSDRVDLQVRDFGTGIPADRLPKVFEPFFSTKSGPDETGKGGTGLGLHACRKIIQGHGGKIRVDSTVGKGTAFTIRLPVAAPPSAPATTSDSLREGAGDCSVQG